MAKKRTHQRGLRPGRALEMLTARIEGALSNSEVKIKSPDHLPDRVAGGTREVDVSLRIVVGSAEVVIIIECRDRTRKPDITWIEQIRSKRDAVGASKAIAVATGTFSKKARAAASTYGIDVRTLTEVNRMEIKRWIGTVQMFKQRVSYTDANVTVVIGGAEPLPPDLGERFTELVRADTFEARFIVVPQEQQLMSPLDFVRKRHTSHRLQHGASATIIVPPNGKLVISTDPAVIELIGELPEDGSPVPREHVLSFGDGEAYFEVAGALRPIQQIRLTFNARLEFKEEVETDAFRYASTTGVIEVARKTAELPDGGEFVAIEHRKKPD